MGAKVPQFRTLPREHLNYCQHLSALLVSDLVLRSIGFRQPKEHSPWSCQRRSCIFCLFWKYLVQWDCLSRERIILNVFNLNYPTIEAVRRFEHLTLCISVQVAEVCNWYMSTCITRVSKFFLRLICCCIIFHLLMLNWNRTCFFLIFA